MSSTFFPPNLSPFALTGVLPDARPEPITIDPERAALLVIDMQNDFGTKGGMFDRAGIDISQIQKAAAPTARVIAAARRAGMKVIYLKMGFRPDLSDAGPKDSPNWIKHQAMHLGEGVQAPHEPIGHNLPTSNQDASLLLIQCCLAGFPVLTSS
jgi:hypothetical protein